MPKSQPNRANLLRFALFASITGIVFIAFALAALAGGRGELVLPLDDVYIHFQYAKQAALGQPYNYNPGDAPTSGATSFLYPWLLALGYNLGFTGLNLGWWALLIGAASLWIAIWALYRLCLALGLPQNLSLLTTVAFGLSGSIAWHVMSGMETGLMLAFTLLTLLMVATRNLRGFALSASLLAITRPEGSIMAFIAAALMLPRMWSHVADRRHLLWLSMPVLAIFAQPILNYLITGTVVASGSQAKSVFGAIPFDLGAVITRITEQWLRMWAEFFTGYNPLQGWYLPPLLGLLALVGVLLLLMRRDWRWVGLLLLAWFVSVSGAIATLDTAFWHFKRYQVPLMALFYPLATYALWRLAPFIRRAHTSAQKSRRIWQAIFAIGFALFLLPLFAQFVHYHATNVGYIYAQPLQMARWLAANTPPDATVAVHDVGMMRYLGERRTLDIVGLTTPDAAQYWRNGPGAVAELLLREQPDYIASYGRGHGYGLGMLENTELYENLLAGYPVETQAHLNVALAADFQGIYAPEYRGLDPALSLFVWGDHLFTSAAKLGWLTEHANPFQRIDVADPQSEDRFQYAWEGVSGGFASIPHQFIYRMMSLPLPLDSPPILDAVRDVKVETFVVGDLQTDLDLVLVTRLHGQSAGTLNVYANGRLADSRLIAERPGLWQDVATLIPAEFVEATTTIRIESENGVYQPAQHTLIQGHYQPPAPEAFAASYQRGNLGLESVTFSVAQPENPLDGVRLQLTWYTSGNTTGDYRFFAHLYNDINQPPVAQLDRYLADGDTPLGNLLRGRIQQWDYILLADTPPGVYQLAIGFYNPHTLERLQPQSDVYAVTEDGRLFLGEVSIE